MKILFVISYFYPALTYGGPAKVAYDLAKELSKENQVTVYTTDVWDAKRRIKDSEKLESTKNFRVFYFRNIINSIAFTSRLFTGFGMVLEYLKTKDKFEIVHIHDVFILPQILIGYLAIIYKKPFVVSPHGVLDPIRTENKAFLKSLMLVIARPVLQNAKTLIATSDDEKKVLLDLGFINVKTVVNGVDVNIENPSTKYLKFNKSDKLTFLYVGKIHKLKGLEEFVEAVSMVNYDYQVIIAGPDDGGKTDLQDKITKLGLNTRIHFIDFVSEKEKSELFSIADIFIYPSRSEGFSISILEALKYSVPVLITDECNFDEVAIHKAGLVLDAKNLKSNIYSAIKDLNKSLNIFSQMGTNGRKLVESKYSIEAMGKQVQKLYEIFN
jgi:glycosyltransferase involved in cell wall biosynthesis